MLFISSFQILAASLSKCYRELFYGLVQKFFYECVACVCLTIGTIYLVIAFFMALGFLMDVLNVSFALPIDLYKSLWNSEKVWFTKILF